MSTLTPRLLLKRPDGADPFLRQDFVDNWNKIDAAPGTHVCTSSTRPTWAAAQAGRTIIETDTYRQMLWTGTAWIEPNPAPSQWAASILPAQYLGKGASATYTLGSITTKRSATLAVQFSVRSACQPYASQGLQAWGLIDGVDRTVSGNESLSQWADLSSATSTAYDHRTGHVLAQVNVLPGTHSYGIKVKVGAGANQVYIGTLNGFAMLTTNPGQ